MCCLLVWLDVYGYDLVIEDAGYGDGDCGAGAADGNGLASDEQTRLFCLGIGGEAELEGLCAYGEEVAVGTFHCHGIREVDEVDGDGAGITPDGDVEEAGAFNLND